MNFNISNPSSINKNPTLARAFIKLVPPFELVKIVLNGSLENSVIDQAPIVLGILEAGQPDLTLVLVTYGNLMCVEMNNIVSLIQSSPAHKAAIYANQRIKWYWHTELKEIAVGEILREENKPNRASELVRLLLSNPRFDREWLGQVIRGKEDFMSLPLSKRTLVAFHCLGVEEVKSPDWNGKDGPDCNELYFRKPCDAFPTLVRDVFTDAGEIEFKKFANEFAWVIWEQPLGIESQDWMGASEATGAFDELVKFVELAYVQSESIPFIDFRKRKITPAGMSAIFAIHLLKGVFNSEFPSWGNNGGSVIVAMFGSASRVVRAAAFAIVFSRIPVGDDAIMNSHMFDDGGNDSFEKWFGIIATKAFYIHWRWDKEHDWYLINKRENSSFGQGLYETIPCNFTSTFTRLFDTLDLEDVVKSHNRTAATVEWISGIMEEAVRTHGLSMTQRAETGPECL